MPVASEMLSNTPSAADFTSVFIIPKMPLERAIGSSFATVSPSFLSINPGKSLGFALKILAARMGNASPSMNVCATTVSAFTCAPRATRTSPVIGNTRRARYVVRAVTVSPGVNALAMCLLERCLTVCTDQPPVRTRQPCPRITHTHAARSAISESWRAVRSLRLEQ